MLVIRTRARPPCRPALLIFCTLVLSACSTGDEASESAAPDWAGPGDLGAVAPGQPVDVLPEGVEAISLLGNELRSPEMGAEVRASHKARLDSALARFDADPSDATNAIWVGRRTAYLGRYREAIGVFSTALDFHPDEPRLYRHRGHRWITVREFERAREDLLQAVALSEGLEDRVEPDGLPNPAGIPRTTLHFNIWYHLGLAHYLLGEVEQAVLAWREALDVSQNDDSVVAASYWLHNALRRLNLERTADEVLAPIHDGMEILENGSYLELLLLHRGERSEAELMGAPGQDALTGATTMYGVALWHEVNGRREMARQLKEALVAESSQWAAFGYVAAEADLAREQG